MASLSSAVSNQCLKSSLSPKAALVAPKFSVATSRAPVVVRADSRSSENAVSRRDFSLASAVGLLATAVTPLPALADFEEKYQRETSYVIDKVRATLNLPRDDPNRSDAVNELRELSNDWVAKYRREKNVAGRPSFSNMYSVLNAISGHYISFGPTYPIPKKRQDRIFEEIDIAEKALARGR